MQEGRPRREIAHTPPISVSVGVFAHNEGSTIGAALGALLSQRTSAVVIAEIIVVSCGSTDATVRRAREVVSDLVTVVDRPLREGKAKAIDAFLDLATSDIVVLAAADTIPSPFTVERLARALCPPIGAGMAGGRVRPLVTGPAFVAILHDVLWDLHHHVAEQRPKLGEIVAVRRDLVPTVGGQVGCDEVLIEWMVTSSGLSLHYDPEALIGNLPPASVRSLLHQRRRIACQHLASRKQLRYRPATNQLGPVLRGVARVLQANPGRCLHLAALLLLEATARVLGRWDHGRGDRYLAWSSARPLVDVGPARR